MGIPRSANAVVKRDGGFATQDSAKTAGREDAKRMKNSRQPDKQRRIHGKPHTVGEAMRIERTHQVLPRWTLREYA